ncbi:MAG: lysophospholipid acyltransferase family protein [Gemmatimonadaceae bacterium]
MRAILVGLTFLVATPFFGGLTFLAALLRLPDVEGSVYDWAPRGWARALLWAGGVKLHLHHAERISHSGARIYVSNHVSWYDVFALAGVLPRYKWIAKAELGRIPIFGPAARSAGMIFIERNNKKAAFAQYELAASNIHAGASVIVCPESTRGADYRLRPFKKGPFVLAIAAGVPIVPTIVHGTIAIHPKGSWRVRRGDVHLHFLEEISTEGYTHDRRDELTRETWTRMADTLRTEYGIDSERSPGRVAVGVTD